MSSENRQEAPPTLCGYAADVTAERLSKMLSYAESVLANEETEPVHQMRVWSRRTRAALEIFQDCFAGKEFTELEREVKTVTGALGAARDLDVMIESLSKRAQALPPAQQPGLKDFIDHLQTRRRDQQKAVERAIMRMERHDLLHRFNDLAARHAARRPDEADGGRGRDDHG